MVKCPSCGYDAKDPVKTWPIPSRRPLKEGEAARLTGIFDCPSCRARFRAALEPETMTQTANIKNVVDRIRDIKEGLMQTLTNLREKIRMLETERASLMSEIENLKRLAESRVDALESEVGALRGEVQSLRDLLDYSAEKEKQESA